MTETLFRIVRKNFQDQAFSGIGARDYGGRWNAVGTPCVYMSGNLALAAFENLVHIGEIDLLASYVYFKAELKSSHIYQLPDPDYPSDWESGTIPASTQILGTKFLKEGKKLALAVKSMVIPKSINYVLNIGHKNFPTIKIEGPYAFTYDNRLVTSRR